MSFTPKPSGNVVNSFSGSTTTTHTKSSGYWKSLSITNDDASTDLTFTVNNITITVKPNEEFSGDFVDFNSVTVTTTVTYRLVTSE